jgi:DNA topoisomerase-2
MVFNKKRSEERKNWLSNYDRNSYLDTNNTSVSYTDFINKELIHFSKYDCERSIPNLMDGLKISLRKILYSAFKKNLTSEIKVAQFSGYVSEQSGYHHGEASLNAAIVGMAQDFVGSNNINLLLPNGQFGTRLQGGKDSASERYIFTQLSPVTRLIYRKEDDPILDYLDDDGFPVEPRFYVPIIPMILVNGGKGIGTGFSTDILSYDPLILIDYLQGLLNLQENEQTFTPYYKGFQGCYLPFEGKKFILKGKYTKTAANKIKVEELPIGYWTEDFKQHIENLMEGDKTKKTKGLVKDYNDMSTDKKVDVEIIFHEPVDESMELNGMYNKLEKALKLYTTQSTNNMHLFNHEEKLSKYEEIEDILNAYVPVRLDYYQKRKDYQIQTLERELKLLSNKAKYIQENLDGTIDLRNKKKDLIIKMLEDKEYDKIDGDNDFKYLLKMPMDSVSEENAEKIKLDKENKEKEMETLKSTTIQEIWLRELSELKCELTNSKTIKINKK